MKLNDFTKIHFDILNKTISPMEKINENILIPTQNYYKWFPKLVLDTGLKIEIIKTFTMDIEFDFNQSRPFSMDKNIVENHFICKLFLKDDKGKEYYKKFDDWWFPEN